jgi:glutamate 5-kinase
VLGVRGDFAQGDPVSIISLDGTEVGRGLARYSMPEVARLAGARASDIEARLGHYAGDAIVHRDDLVVL